MSERRSGRRPSVHFRGGPDRREASNVGYRPVLDKEQMPRMFVEVERIAMTANGTVTREEVRTLLEAAAK